MQGNGFLFFLFISFIVHHYEEIQYPFKKEKKSLILRMMQGPGGVVSDWTFKPETWIRFPDFYLILYVQMYFAFNQKTPRMNIMR